MTHQWTLPWVKSDLFDCLLFVNRTAQNVGRGFREIWRIISLCDREQLIEFRKVKDSV